MPLLWVSVTSDAIKEVGYDPLNGDLRIVFHPRNTAYLWPNVGLSVIEAMFSAPSLGSFVRTHLVGRGGSKRLAGTPQQKGVRVTDLFGAILDFMS